MQCLQWCERVFVGTCSCGAVWAVRSSRAPLVADHGTPQPGIARRSRALLDTAPRTSGAIRTADRILNSPSAFSAKPETQVSLPSLPASTPASRAPGYPESTAARRLGLLVARSAGRKIRALRQGAGAGIESAVIRIRRKSACIGNGSRRRREPGKEDPRANTQNCHRKPGPAIPFQRAAGKGFIQRATGAHRGCVLSYVLRGHEASNPAKA